MAGRKARGTNRSDRSFPREVYDPELDFHRIENGNVDEGDPTNQKIWIGCHSNVFRRKSGHGFKVWKITSRRMIFFQTKGRTGSLLQRPQSTVLRSMEFIGLKHKSKPARMKRWRKRVLSQPFASFRVQGQKYFHPDRECTYAIGSGCENQGIKVWDCPSHGSPVRWNAGWTRMNEPIQKFLKRSGRNITPIQDLSL